MQTGEETVTIPSVEYDQLQADLAHFKYQLAELRRLMYSFFATCKLNEVNPYLWLKDTLEKLPDTPVNGLDHLLPHRWVPADV